MKKFLLLVFVASFISVTSNAQNNAQSEVMMKMMSLKNALLSKDSVALSGLLADDATYGHSSGLIQSKAELIRSIMSAEQDYKTIEPSNMNVRTYNDNTGVVTINLKVNVVYQGKALDLNLATVLVWVKINGDWKLVSRQAVKLPA